MARRIKIQERSCPSIKEAFDDFLLHKKASGLAEKTCRTYSEQFAAICKHLDSSAPITSLVKRQLEEILPPQSAIEIIILFFFLSFFT